MPISSAPALQPLVLLPGLLCDSLLYASQIAGLANVADCWVPAPTGHDSIESMARQVLADCPFERFSLAGLSMGGYVAQEIVHQAPQRVERLALLDTNALADTPEGSAGRRALLELAQARGLAPVVDALLPRLVWPQAPEATRLHAIVLAMARNVGPAAFVRQQAAIMARRDRRDDLARIACPTLVACGAHDILTPVALHEDMARRIPGAVLEIFSDCGHLAPLERPGDVLAALRDWLARA